MTKPTITPGQIFFRQHNMSSVSFVRVHDVIGDTIYFQHMDSEKVEGSRTSMSHEVKPIPQGFKLTDIWQNTLEYNEFVGYHFGGNLDLEMGPFIPYYELFTKETITLHDRD
jgi:hypothetical protein